jgi:hypothetical protein
MNTNTPSTDQVLAWHAPRAVNHERTVGWYLTGGIVVIGATVYGVLSGVWTLALVSILCGALYFLVRDHRFPDIDCTMTDKGVQIAERFLPWTGIKGFWFVTTPAYTELHIVPQSKKMTDLVIHTGDVSLITIRSFLSGKADELHDKQERILDILARLIKL